MGMIHHHAVLATTWDKKRADQAVGWIETLSAKEREFFVVGPAVMNHYQTIVLIPDGSKEGWEESDKGDARRAKFIEFLKTHDYSDGSSPWAWVEVGFGEFGANVEKTNQKNCY